MALLIFGLAIWSAAHLFGVVAPAARAGLTGKLGEHRAKGMMAGVILSGLVLMVLGYRMTDYVALYTPPTWAVHLNNLLMLAAIYLMGVGGENSWGRWPRPQHLIKAEGTYEYSFVLRPF